MKRIFASLMAIMLIFGTCAIYASAADSFVVALTDFDGVMPEESDDTFAPVFVYPAENTDRVVTSEEFNFRFLFVLVCDKDGRVIEAGNNLFKASDPRANEFPQHDVTAPAGGHVVAFRYNNDVTANQALFDFYTEAIAKFAPTTDVYNETVKLTNCTYTITFKASSVTFTKDALEAAPDDSTDESADASSDASADESSDASADESADASDVSSEASDAASSEATSSAVSNGTSATSSAPTFDASESNDDDGAPIGLIVGISIAVIAVIAVAVVFIKKKK